MPPKRKSKKKQVKKKQVKKKVIKKKVIKKKQATKNKYDDFRKLLIKRKIELSRNIETMKTDILKMSSKARGNLSSTPIHMADVGSDNYQQEFSLSILQNEDKELRLINEALKRIEEGTYDKCDDCGKKIPQLRLKAIPYAKLCIKCKEKIERNR